MSVIHSTIHVDEKKVTFSVESGVVVGLQRFSDAHVQETPFVNHGRVHTQIVRSTEFGLIDTKGVERAHQFDSHEMFLRNGHRVSLIYASHKNRAWVYLVNHDTRKHLTSGLTTDWSTPSDS